MLTRDGAAKLAYRHPWLYHVVHRADEGTRETVASDGLAPGPSRHRWHPLFTPRPGHVYLATMGYISSAPWNLWRQGDEMYAVDTSLLVPDRVNPDEDNFSTHMAGACDRFNLPRPAGMELWKMFRSVVPSYGDWADQVDLGSDPAHIAHSLRHGSLAYRGVIPPTALRRWDGKQWSVLGSDPNGQEPHC